MWRGGSSEWPRTFAARRKITPTGASSPRARGPSALAFVHAAAAPPAAPGVGLLCLALVRVSNTEEGTSSAFFTLTRKCPFASQTFWRDFTYQTNRGFSRSLQKVCNLEAENPGGKKEGSQCRGFIMRNLLIVKAHSAIMSSHGLIAQHIVTSTAMSTL